MRQVWDKAKPLPDVPGFPWKFAALSHFRRSRVLAVTVELTDQVREKIVSPLLGMVVRHPEDSLPFRFFSPNPFRTYVNPNVLKDIFS